MLVFIPCVGEYVIPELLGGPQTQMIGRTLWDEFFSNNDWPMACDRRRGDDPADHRAAGGVQPLPGRGGGAAGMRRCARPPLQPLASRAAGSRSATRSCTCRSSRWSSTRSTTRRSPNVWRGFTLQVVRARSPATASCSPASWLSLKIAFVHRLRVGRARHPGRVRARHVPALLRPHAVRRHGQRAAGDARGDHRPVAAADAGVGAARDEAAFGSACPSAAC